MSDEAAALASLLLAGHALGDFVFQTDAMIRRKNEWPTRLAHVLMVALCQTALLLPFASGEVLLAVAAIAAAHFAIDSTKAAVSARWPAHDLPWFVLDQLLHLGVLAVAWHALLPHLHFVDVRLAHPRLLAKAGVLIAAYAFHWNGMSAVVALLLARNHLALKPPGPAAGRIIGILERMFALTLVLLNHWEALGFLVAAKALARFKDLEHRAHAEYYLVGTLVSLLGATLTAIALRALLRL